MIDIHNHMLFGIDDGSSCIEDSVEVLRDMYEYGYTDIILTPHYIKDSRYNSNKKNNQKLLKKLQNELELNNIKLNLYLGNEIFMDDEIYDLLKEKEISSLNGSKYLLIELPMNGEYPNYEEIFEDLIDRGYKVILAHPERYLSFQEDYSRIEELEEIGVLFQSNIDSLNGKYGPYADKMLRWLLKEKKISFLATDIHRRKHNYKEWKKAKDIATKYISKDEFEMLTVENPSKIIR